MSSINILDAALLVILGFFSIRGLLRGLVHEVAGLFGFAAGFLLAKGFSERLAPVLTGYGISEAFSSVLAFAILFITGIILVGIAARALHSILDAAFAGGIDRLLGLAAGFAKGLILSGIVGYIALRLIPEAAVVKSSQVIPPLMDIIQWLAGSFNLNIPKI